VIVFAAEATERARIKDQMSRVAEQHATAIEELQSTNEELETTNEELQSANEELETTNEELQSTNEELETTVEELQAANTELSTVNVELERRTHDLKRLDEYQRTVLDSLVAAVLVLNREGVVTTWNHRAEQMWKLRSDHVVGRPLVSLPIDDVPLPQLTRDAVRRVLETGTAETVREVPYLTDKGEERRTTLRLTALRDADGKVSGVVGVATADEVA
jgi:two-component system CheB/CheR fusion protein